MRKKGKEREGAGRGRLEEACDQVRSKVELSMFFFVHALVPEAKLGTLVPGELYRGTKYKPSSLYSGTDWYQLSEILASLILLLGYR